MVGSSTESLAPVTSYLNIILDVMLNSNMKIAVTTLYKLDRIYNKNCLVVDFFVEPLRKDNKFSVQELTIFRRAFHCLHMIDIR